MVLDKSSQHWFGSGEWVGISAKPVSRSLFIKRSSSTFLLVRPLNVVLEYVGFCFLILIKIGTWSLRFRSRVPDDLMILEFVRI